MAGFILFNGRVLNTSHMVSLIPPRPDGGKHILEARMVGGVSFLEDFGDADEARTRFLELANTLLSGTVLAAPTEFADVRVAPALSLVQRLTEVVDEAAGSDDSPAGDDPDEDDLQADVPDDLSSLDLEPEPDPTPEVLAPPEPLPRRTPRPVPAVQSTTRKSNPFAKH